MNRSLSLAFRMVGAALLAVLLSGFRPISVSRVGPLSDVAIEGYDPVAYFTDGRAVRGRAILQTEWRGARWYFSSPEHKRLFEADPERYAPAFGGYCAMCVGATGEAATSGDPRVFLIFEDRLYLLQNEEMRDLWLKDVASHTRQAAETYARLLAAAGWSGR